MDNPLSDGLDQGVAINSEALVYNERKTARRVGILTSVGILAIIAGSMFFAFAANGLRIEAVQQKTGRITTKRSANVICARGAFAHCG
jgi:hypothetical protein